jgi:hypothetical protein
MEQRALAKYLVGVEATPYQAAKYVAGHRLRAITPRNRFDRRLLRIARSGWVGLAVVDAYTGTLYRVGIVRAKLVLTLAVLECSPPSFAVLDAPDRGGRLVLWRMAARVAGAFGLLLASIALLGPIHVSYAALERWRR